MSHKKPREYYEYDSERDNESINCCQLDIHKQLIRERNSSTQSTIPFDIHKKRSCTDTFCLLLFVVAIISWIVIIYIVCDNGGPKGLIAVRDSNNRQCGFDKGVKNRPYLLFFDVTKCLGSRNNIFSCDAKQVCVSKCPATNFSVSHYLENDTPLDVIKDKLICVDEFSKEFQINSYEDVKNAVKAGYCTEWYMESEPVARLCLPRYLPSKSHSEENVRLNLPEGTNTELSAISYTFLKSAVYQVRTRDGFFYYMERGIAEYGPYIPGFILLAFVICYIIIVLMRWITGIIVWSSLLALLGVLVFSSVYTWMKYSQTCDHEVVLRRTKEVAFSNLRNNLKLMERNIIRDKNTWLSLFILSVVVLVLTSLILLFLRQRIKVAIQILKEGSIAVSHAWSSLFFPIFPLSLQILALVPAVVCSILLISYNDQPYIVSGLNESQCTCQNGYKDNDVCDVETFRNNCNDPYGNQCSTAKCSNSVSEWDGSVNYILLFNLLMMLWCQFFLVGFYYMSLAMTFATYYWTAAKRKLPFCLVGASVCKVVRYHLGTVAFGSFLLAFLTWIRLLVNLLYRKFSTSDKFVARFLKCCCGLNLLHKLLRIFSNNGYIMCAIKGTNFCTSASYAFQLIVQNIVRASVLDGITSFIFLLMKLLITVCMGMLAYYVFSSINSYSNDYYDEIFYYSGPIFVVCLCTFIVATFAFGVYSVAVDTIFLCALEDLEKNDGTPEKPYVMSKGLIKVFKVKNDRANSAS